MKACLFLLLIAVGYTLAADKISCYTCNKVLEECKIDDATPVACGGNAVCLTQVKKGAPNNDLAIRKCAIPDVRTKKVDCPAGWECTECNTSECNKNSGFINQGANLITILILALVPKFYF